MRIAWTSLACLLLTSVVARASDNPVLQNIDREIRKEPEYVAKRPLYCFAGIRAGTPQKRSAGSCSTI